MKLATDSLISMKIKSVIISVICLPHSEVYQGGKFFSTISNKCIFGVDSYLK